MPTLQPYCAASARTRWAVPTRRACRRIPACSMVRVCYDARLTNHRQVPRLSRDAWRASTPTSVVGGPEGRGRRGVDAMLGSVSGRGQEHDKSRAWHLPCDPCRVRGRSWQMIEILLVLLRRWLGVPSWAVQGVPAFEPARCVAPLQALSALGRFSVGYGSVRRARPPAVLRRARSAGENTALGVRAAVGGPLSWRNLLPGQVVMRRVGHRWRAAHRNTC